MYFYYLLPTTTGLEQHVTWFFKEFYWKCLCPAVDCDKLMMMMIKIIQPLSKTYSFFIAETGTTIRTCLDSNPSEINHTCRTLENAATKSMQPLDPNFKIKHCSVCNTDSCNGASSAAFSVPLATLALVATYLLCNQ